MIRSTTLIALASLGLLVFAAPSVAEDDASDAPEATELELPEDAIRDEGLSLDERAYLRLSGPGRALLDEGSYSVFGIAGVALTSTVIGFGSGQLVEKRWTETGWIFTLGESAGLGLMLGWHTSCDNDDPDDENLIGGEFLCKFYAIFIGGIIVAGFRIAGIVESSIHMARHNRKVRRVEETKQRLRERIEREDRGIEDDLSFFVHPNRDGGATFTLGLRF